ncbi:MAG TPA: TIGR03619 family F420-dependent LLM class oxidoreductase [Acetobacteraceae bacterium]|nr:TIGR03619 family F420-dependent LLM class oxidoreductase [Acetobacteraceae bacterium]
MQYGSALPITAFADPNAATDYAAALEAAGFDFTSTSGHVMAQPAGTHPQRPSRQYAGPFYDPFVTFSFLAAATRRLRFITGILILPAWPTVLVAKQAAELALICGGRFALGVGLSWNAAEYAALGQNFRDRGRRIEEQVRVLKLLWSQPYVTFDGQYHTLENVGLNRAGVPAIPIWFGSETGEPALRRVARLANGWMSMGDPTPHLPRLRRYMQEAGRDPQTMMVRGPLVAGDDGPAAWIAVAKVLQAAGVTHLNIAAPLDMPPAQALPRVIEARRVLADALG